MLLRIPKTGVKHTTLTIIAKGHAWSLGDVHFAFEIFF